MPEYRFRLKISHRLTKLSFLNAHHVALSLHNIAVKIVTLNYSTFRFIIFQFLYLLLQKGFFMSQKEKKKIKLFSNLQLIVGATVIFSILILFLDNSNIQYKRELQQHLIEITRQRDSLQEQIARDSLIINKIKNDDAFLERYAREHFYMKIPGEDVYIFE